MNTYYLSRIRRKLGLKPYQMDAIRRKINKYFFKKTNKVAFLFVGITLIAVGILSTQINASNREYSKNVCAVNDYQFECENMLPEGGRAK